MNKDQSNDAGKVKRTYYLSSEVEKALREHGFRQDMSYSEVVEAALRLYLFPPAPVGGDRLLLRAVA
jgi:hypothetical protein